MRRQNRHGSLALFAGCLLGACRSEPAPSAPSESAASLASGAPVAASPPAAAPPSAAAAPSLAAPSPSVGATAAQVAPSSSAPVPGPGPDPAADPPLFAEDGSRLPQTEARPSTTSARFERRMRQLAGSILTGDAELGRASFFPLPAYAQVKAVQKPERDYRYRLMANFERDIRDYHRALGKDAAQAEFLGVEVPEARAQWMAPGKEGNRLGYFRVLRSRLRFRLAAGAEKTFELTSMISWRGEWYVVHLHGFE